MTTLNTLETAPTLDDFTRKIRQYEETMHRYQASSYDFKLYPTGMLKISSKALQGEFSVSEQAIPDLARITAIPATFFNKCDSRFRSVSFNWQIHKEAVPDTPVQILLKDGVIDRIQNTNLLPAPRLAIIDTISNAKPSDIQKENLRVIQHSWDGQFDISIIAPTPTMSCSPRKDDLIAFGINISEGRDGSIQVQGAAFRLICSNGAVNRVCDSRQHRLRRPINCADRQQQFLKNVAVFASEAWNYCKEQMNFLPKLVNEPLDIHDLGSLRSRLRQAPFFLSARLINQVIQRLEFEIALHQESASLYDLYNAMSYLGTHNDTLSATYRMRLRLGAGEFTRHEPRICPACRQLKLEDRS